MKSSDALTGKPFDLAQGKWRKFLKRVKLFRFVPFVDFVLAAGSLATGKVHEKSDFDVIVGVKGGRIFTVRFLSVLFFEFFGWRRKRVDSKETATDKICLNHFVAPKGYRLRPPYNDYWREMYRNLVPIIGDEAKIKSFLESNDWLTPPATYKRDPRYLGEKSFVARIGELLLGGRIGDYLEKIVKKEQIKRIEAHLPESLKYNPRLIYNDHEMEFHH
ncbi:MAG: hypothetical protein HYW00_01050 [Candidatus Colwellbacteria bacterium]|nr:hypothetical protein [Candidatus Colwellbacteria bacterium]